MSSAAQMAFVPLAALALGGALLTVTRRNAVYAALAMVLSFMGVAGLYFLLGAEFLGIMQVLVYAGAIIVLFLFVIMLLDLRRGAPDLVRGSDRPFHPGAALVALAVFVLTALPALQAEEGWPALEARAGFGSIAALGQAIYREHALAFEMVGLLILAAVVAAVALTGRGAAE